MCCDFYIVRLVINMYKLILLLFLPIFTLSQQTINGSIMHNNVQRDYILYAPAMYNVGNSTPLVFNFHGLTGTSTIAMWHADFRSISDTANFIIVHPQGLLNSSGETHWNIGQIGTSINDIDFVSALLDSLSLEYNIDSDRVYSTGMSNGAYMSYRLACELSNRIAAIAPVAGSYISYMLNSCNPTHPTPVMHIHGVSDTMCIYTGKPGVESIPSIISYWVDYNQCDTQDIFTQVANINLTDSSTAEHYIWENGIDGVAVEHFKIIDGGHTWPGSNSPNSNGITNFDIDASTKIWRFFSKYDITGLINPATFVTEGERTNKKLLRIVDILGRECKEETNKPLFYIFEDGTVIKKMIIN